jgi:predicted O-methyltransferase YrrM
MDYKTFYEKFGGSARTKHLAKRRFGGRYVVPSNKRIATIPDVSGLPRNFIRLCPWEMEYIFCVARRARIGILEVGRFNGGSTFMLSCSNPNVPIHSIDLAPQNDDFLKKEFERHGVGQNVSLIVGDSQNTKYPEVQKIDVLFIDGDHYYDGCSADIVNWYGNLVRGGHLLFHDSYLGGVGVQDAILDFIDKHPEIEVVKSPYIGAMHWHYPAGSVCHLIKRGD